MTTGDLNHLDGHAVLRWQCGEVSDTERAHVAACPACQKLVRPMESALTWFGAAAREWGEAKSAVVLDPRQARPARSGLSSGFGSMTLAWAAVCALLLVVFGLGLPRWQARQAAQQAALHRQQAQQQITQDDALLDAIDQDVSQVVPHALTPLSVDSSQSQQ